MTGHPHRPVSADSGVGVDDAEPHVLGVVDRLVDQLADEVVLGRAAHVSALALPVGHTDVAQQPELARPGRPFK